MLKIAVCIFLAVAPLLAQDRVATGAPTAAATIPVFEASAGYVYLDLDNPSAQRVGLSGVDANGSAELNARWGMVVDLSYARTGNVFGTGHSGNVLSGLAGPVFYPAEYRNARIFVHTLAGVSVVDSAVPLTRTDYLSGPVAKFSFALGGGFERHLSGPLAIRIGGDYLRTTFANSHAAMQSQNNLRIVASIVYRFGNR
jgi:hypothetical protein